MRRRRKKVILSNLIKNKLRGPIKILLVIKSYDVYDIIFEDKVVYETSMTDLVILFLVLALNFSFLQGL